MPQSDAADPSDEPAGGNDPAAVSDPAAATGSGTTIGPISADILKPARFLAGAQAGIMALIMGAAVIAALALLPRTLAGFGLLAPTPATVTSTGTHGDNPDTSCTLTQLQIDWGGDHTDSLTWCSHEGESVPAVGDTVDVWVLPSFGPSQADSRSTDTALAVALLLAFLAAGAGSLVFGRRLRAVRALERHSVPTVALRGQVDRLAKQRGVFKKDMRMRARIVLGPGPEGPLEPLTVTLAHMSDNSLLGARLEVYPAGRTRRGRPTGPYVLRRVRYGDSPSGTLIGLGRAYRAEHDIRGT